MDPMTWRDDQGNGSDSLARRPGERIRQPGATAMDTGPVTRDQDCTFHGSSARRPAPWLTGQNGQADQHQADQHQADQADQADQHQAD